MKKLICHLLVYLFCQLIPFNAYAVVVGYSRIFGGEITYLLNEDFETNETCTELGFSLDGTPDCQATDYKDGNYGNKLSSIGTTEGITEIVAENSLVYVKFDIRISALDYFNYIVAIQDGGSFLGRFRTDSSGNFSFLFSADADQSFTVFTPSVDTWYTVKIRYQCDTGTSNGSAYIWYSAGQNQTLSTSLGAADASLTGKAQTGTPLADQYEWLNSKTGVDIWYDNIKVSTGDPDA